MKQITITVPDNCELKQDDNNYTIVEKEKKLTYKGVARKLFSRRAYYIYSNSTINACNGIVDENICDGTNCTSQKQAEKLLAINKLMNVAKYLNGDWQPNWNDVNDYKWFIYFSNEYKTLNTDCVHSMQQHFIYFKSEELARQAIEILGEEIIKLALCTDY